jgi:hypothetical protein
MCPRCYSEYLSRSHVKWWESLVRLVSTRRPFRCQSCRWRGWQPVKARSGLGDRAGLSEQSYHAVLKESS